MTGYRENDNITVIIGIREKMLISSVSSRVVEPRMGILSFRRFTRWCHRIPKHKCLSKAGEFDVETVWWISEMTRSRYEGGSGSYWWHIMCKLFVYLDEKIRKETDRNKTIGLCVKTRKSWEWGTFKTILLIQKKTICVAESRTQETVLWLSFR